MMNNEEFERKMAFIVNQQAQFALDIETLFEAQKLTEQKLQESNDVVTRLAYVTNEGFKDVNAKINALIDSQIDLRESQKQTDQQIKETGQQLKEIAQQLEETGQQLKETDLRLRKLTDTVDRYIRNRTNGTS
jgi:ABC-type transporter Mla subunit MlaD